MRLPLIVRFPDARRVGVVDERVSLVGLTPSLLDWLGIERPDHLQDAADLDGTAEAPLPAEYRDYFSESERAANVRMRELYPELPLRTAHRHVVYHGDHKLIRSARGETFFYDLAQDPMEQRDLSDDGLPSMAGVDELYRALLASGRFTPFDAEWSEEERREALERVDDEALRALGYLQ